jgi:putative membrane protein
MGVQSLNPAEARRVCEAIEAAETGTSGEIFVAVARSSDDYGLVPVLWAATAALLAVWPLHLFTSLSINAVLGLQAAIFILVALAVSPVSMRTRLAPPWLVDEEVARAARDQFLSHGVHLTDERTGVLIFVSIAEHRVEIVADDGIAARVGQNEWDDIAADVVRHTRQGQLSSGLVEAVDHAGRLLREHFPAGAGNRNELPNTIIQL